MATFIRKMVKEVQDVKQLINIPEMKQQRDLIKHDIQLNADEIAKYELCKKSDLNNLITMLNVFNEQTPNFFPTPELHTSSINLVQFFKQYSETNITLLLTKQADLQDKLEKIKNKINKARN